MCTCIGSLWTYTRLSAHIALESIKGSARLEKSHPHQHITVCTDKDTWETPARPIWCRQPSKRLPAACLFLGHMLAISSATFLIRHIATLWIRIIYIWIAFLESSGGLQDKEDTARGQAIDMSSNFYPEPESFDSLRFAKLRESVADPALEGRAQFVAVCRFKFG